MTEANSQPPQNQLPPSARNDPKAAAIAQEAITRGKSHAATVGVGVHKQYVAPGPDKKPSETPDEDIKLENGWDEKATIKDQINRGPEYWKLDRVEVKVFDLTNAEQLKAYNEILTKSNQPDTNVVLVDNKREFSEKTGNWMALVELQYILYRKLLVTKSSSNEQAS